MYQKEIEYIENIYKWNEKNATIQVIYIWKSDWSIHWWRSVWDNEWLNDYWRTIFIMADEVPRSVEYIPNIIVILNLSSSSHTCHIYTTDGYVKLLFHIHDSVKTRKVMCWLFED